VPSSSSERDELALRELLGAPAPRAARGVGRGVLAVWALVCTLGGATLMAGHWVILPEPATDDARLRAGLASLAPDGERWMALHVLYEGCSCSGRVVDHLRALGPLDGVRDHVLLIGDGSIFGRELERDGVPVTYLSPEDLEARFGIVAAPLFVAADPRGEPAFVGGYTERKQGLEIRDREILAALMRGDTTEDVPLYGCGVSEELQRTLDPMGIKYE